MLMDLSCNKVIYIQQKCRFTANVPQIMEVMASISGGRDAAFGGQFAAAFMTAQAKYRAENLAGVSHSTILWYSLGKTSDDSFSI